VEQYMTDSSTCIKLNMEMLIKSISCLPLSTISLVSSYLTMEESSLKSAHSYQTPYFDANVLGPRPSLSSHPLGDANQNHLDSWKKSLLACFRHYLEDNVFSLKVQARINHKNDIVGNSSTYDITLCNSEYFFISKEQLDRSVSEMSLRTGNANMMNHRLNLSLAYIMSLGIRNGDPKGTSIFDPFDQMFKNKDNDDHMSMGENEYDSEMDHDDADNVTAPTTLDAEQQEIVAQKKLKKLLKKTKFFGRSYHMVESEDDENELDLLTPLKTDNTLSCSEDTHFIDEKHLVDNHVDRSYLLLAGCINLLTTLMGILNNLKDVTPDRPIPPPPPPSSTTTTSTSTNADFNAKIPDFPHSNIKKRNDVYAVVMDKEQGNF
jgi:hypothetical protein